MRYDLVIFDCDGTLIDTVTDVAYCLNRSLESCGFMECPYETIASLIGKPLETIVEGLLDAATCQMGLEYSAEDVARVSATYRREYGQYEKPNTKPFPGMVKLVDDLLNGGVLVGVNSNKPEQALTSLVEECFPGRNLYVVGYAPDRQVKPNPAGVFKLMSVASVKPVNVVYIGDTMVDLETAENAGIDCVIVTWGQGTDELYANHTLAAFCSSADDLRMALLK